MRKHTTYNILFVDDDSFLIDMYSLKFSQAGHSVQAVSGVAPALELLRGGYTPDAIVLDLIMPNLDGFALLETIQSEKLAENTARIVLSNQGEKSDLDRARTLGAVGHIIKANTIPSEVLQIVEEIIGKFKKSHHQ